MRAGTPWLELGHWDPERTTLGRVSFDLDLGPVVLSCTAWGVALGAQVPGVGQYLSVRLGFLPQAIYKLKKACRVEMEAEQQSQLLTPEEVVDRIFLLVDENGDGNRGRDGVGGTHSVAPSLSGHVTLGKALHFPTTGPHL